MRPLIKPRTRHRRRIAESVDGVLGFGEVIAVGAVVEGGPRGPTGAAIGDAEGGVGVALRVVGAGVGDFGVVAVVDLPQPPVKRTVGASGGGSVGALR